MRMASKSAMGLAISKGLERNKVILHSCGSHATAGGSGTFFGLTVWELVRSAFSFRILCFLRVLCVLRGLSKTFNHKGHEVTRRLVRRCYGGADYWLLFASF